MRTFFIHLTVLIAKLGWLLAPSAAHAQALKLDQAIARISIYSNSKHHSIVESSPQATPVSLPYVWDTQHPQRSGEAVFELAFALVAPSANPGSAVSASLSLESLPPYALYLARIGTVYEVWLNGSLLSAQGYANASLPSDADYAKAPRLLPIPAQLLQTDNLLRIAVRADAGRGGGLSAMLVGPQDEVAPHYHAAQRWRVSGVLAVLVFSVCVALACALLWLTQPTPNLLERTGRDHLTLWAALGEAAWALVLADHVLERPLLAWPLWGHVVYAATWLAGAMAVLFAYQALAQTRRAPSDNAAARQAVSEHGTQPQLVIGRWLGLSWHAMLVSVSMMACISAALWQAFELQLGAGQGWPSAPWLVYASTLFGLTVAAFTLARHRQDSAQVQDLMATLAQRVADKERDLQRNYAQLEATARTQESAAERSRLLREMHDSVGSHIGLALQQIHAKRSVPHVLGTLRTCLDQLKLSIDSLQLPAGDVASLLANVRYRMAARLASAGIALDWQVALLPSVARFDHQAMRQLQFVLCEAISAALAAPTGSALRVQADTNSDVLRIALLGTGAMFAAPMPSAWQERSAAIGAQICFVPATNAHSVGLQIDIPIHNPALR